jgi:hypothetical protein
VSCGAQLPRRGCTSMASRVSYYRCMWLPELIDGLTATPANSFERGNRVTSAPRLGFPATLGPLFHAEANPSRPAAVLALRLSEREARARSSELRGRKMSRRRVLKQPHAPLRERGGSALRVRGLRFGQWTGRPPPVRSTRRCSECRPQVTAGPSRGRRGRSCPLFRCGGACDALIVPGSSGRHLAASGRNARLVARCLGLRCLPASPLAVAGAVVKRARSGRTSAAIAAPAWRS